jgi:uncharacterized membrane protein|nr:DUF819 family protein [uncultured Pseudoxanthomonas sp.]
MAIEATAPSTALIQNDAVVMGLLAATLAFVFWGASRPAGAWKKFYAVVPALLMCYLLPAIYNSVGLIDGSASGLYAMARDYMLPSSLALFCIAIDLVAILRLGPKAIIMFLTGTAGVMLGAVVSFLALGIIHPETVGGDTWSGMATLAGSWIGGGANQAAMKEVFAVDSTLFGQFVAVDILVANVWMAFLLFLIPRAAKIDRWMGADTRVIDDLRERMESYNAQHARNPSLTDLMIILGIGLGTTGLAHFLATPLVEWIKTLPAEWRLEDFSLTSTFFWMVVIATTVGLLLSFTRARQMEGAGASKVGTAMLYVLIATIGMHMDLKALVDKPWLFLLGAIWILTHGLLLFIVAKLIKAPLFFAAVGSQANIGAAASAPVVASAFHPSLAPVAVLLAVFGYALGTYCAYITGIVLRGMAG